MEAGEEDGQPPLNDDDEPAAPSSTSEGDDGSAGRQQRRQGGGRKGSKAAAAANPARHVERRWQLRKPFLPLRWLQQLADALSHARSAGAMPRVDSSLLAQLLVALEGHVETGLGRVVDDDDGVRAMDERLGPPPSPPATWSWHACAAATIMQAWLRLMHPT